MTQEAASRGLVYRQVPSKIPPRHARVAFYDGLWKIEELQRADLYADIPLEPCGGLDLRKVCATWGLEGCQPIDPMRWTVFEPGNPHFLSSVAVKVLSDYDGCIKIIEPPLSDSAQQKRRMRESTSDITVTFISLMAMIPLAIQTYASEFVDEHTSLARIYRNSWRERKQLKRKAASWVTWLCGFEIDWAAAARLLVVIVTLVMLVAVITGRVELAVRQRARNWAHTGSISL
ncbi:hypothetical protein PLEOSDRAFT_1089696 [Pleurotus ostreatus PC15]|uniref:Uncharacterized protein n=1 Tax=Pleurotus ostreatus (strain PC15) TaxID=1137138 RepID=A0A067NXT3_PLEO1|nr:hypothetical protein PLEOSDRAFT_1089696 [Pleurotus ostreatus PC15]